MASIETLVRERILILDGAMGTMIQQYNLTEDDFRGKRFAQIPGQLKGNNDILCLTRPAESVTTSSAITMGRMCSPTSFCTYFIFSFMGSFILRKISGIIFSPMKLWLWNVHPARGSQRLVAGLVAVIAQFACGLYEERGVGTVGCEIGRVADGQQVGYEFCVGGCG